MALSSTLTEARIAAGLSIAQLAAASGVSPRYIERMEAGCQGPALSSVVPIGTALGITPDRLVREASARMGKVRK